MPFYVRKVRGQEKYRVCIKDNNSISYLHECDSRKEAAEKMREIIYNLVEKEKQQDLINTDTSDLSETSDTEIDDV